VDWPAQKPFLKHEELPDGPALALTVVRKVEVGSALVYIVGGRRLDRKFLASMALPTGMRAMLYRDSNGAFSPGALTDTSGTVAQAEKVSPLISQIQQRGEAGSQVVWWSAEPASAEAVHGIPLKGGSGELLGVLLLASSRREIVELERHIRTVAMLVGTTGVVLGLIFSGWAATWATRPVAQLTDGAREVAAGNWWAQVPITSKDEFGELAGAFNLMTRELNEQRARLVQAERVAAWRELARRLAHELKNPLFPIQITIENLVRARDQNPAEFDEVFRESTATLSAELANLKAIVARFSDFAKMPAPQLQPVQVNEIVQHAIKLLQPQLANAGSQPIVAALDLDPGLLMIQADAELLNRVLQNLILNAIDAMPNGGKLTIRTARRDDVVSLAISDTGTGLTQEECERLFTPYYTTKQHGTGLGLAIAQSVISDHQGTISVESEPGRGSTFRIELPTKSRQTETARGAGG
jgi:signal transduction histidine kinase